MRGLQVAVLVAMPSERRHRVGTEEKSGMGEAAEEMGEFVLGAVCVPWAKKIAGEIESGKVESSIRTGDSAPRLVSDT